MKPDGHCTAQEIGAYYSDSLDARAVRELIEHLSHCEQCLKDARQAGDALIEIDAWAFELDFEHERLEQVEAALQRALDLAVAAEGSAEGKARYRNWRHRVVRSGVSRGPVVFRVAMAEPGSLRRTRSRHLSDVSDERKPLLWSRQVPPHRVVVPTLRAVLIGLDAGHSGGNVALVPDGESRQTQFTQIVPSDEAGSPLIAYFPRVEPGTYTVLFEEEDGP